MTNRNWVGGHGWTRASLNANNPANWSPVGAPARGDYLTMQHGDMILQGYDLAGNELHLNPPLVEYGTGAVNLTLLDGSVLNVGGTLIFGDPLTITASDSRGNLPNHLNGDNLSVVDGTINVGANTDLVVTGKMTFAYFGHLKGTGTITNNGTISIADGDVSDHINGHGTLEMHNYHDGWGAQTITGAIDGGETLLLTPGTHGTRTELAHPDTFKASLKMATPAPLGSYPSLLDIDGIQASRMDIRGDMLRLYGDGNKPLWQVREHMAAGVGASMHDTPTGTEIAFGSPQQLLGY